MGFVYKISKQASAIDVQKYDKIINAACQNWTYWSANHFLNRADCEGEGLIPFY